MLIGPDHVPATRAPRQSTDQLLDAGLSLDRILPAVHTQTARGTHASHWVAERTTKTRSYQAGRGIPGVGEPQWSVGQQAGTRAHRRRQLDKSSEIGHDLADIARLCHWTCFCWQPDILCIASQQRAGRQPHWEAWHQRTRSLWLATGR